MGVQCLPVKGTENTQHWGTFSLKYTVLWALSSATREERQLEPVPGKTQKSQPLWKRTLTELQAYARSPCSGVRCCWVLMPSSGEGVGRRNVADTKDTGSPVKGIYQTYLCSNREHLLYPPITQVFLTWHGHPHWLVTIRILTVSDRLQVLSHLAAWEASSSYIRENISDTTYLNFKVSILEDRYKTFGEYF